MSMHCSIYPPSILPHSRTNLPSSLFLSSRRHTYQAPPSPRLRSTTVKAAISTEMDADARVMVLKKGIAELYDESSGLWEDLWGDHMHHGFYDPDVEVSSSISDHRAAQIRMIEEALRFGGVSGLLL